MKEVDEVRALGVTAFREDQYHRRIPLIMAALRSRSRKSVLVSSQIPEALRALLRPVIAKLETDAQRRAADALFGMRADDGSKTLQKRTEDAYEAYHGSWRHWNTIRSQKAHDYDIVRELGVILERDLEAPPETPPPEAEPGLYIRRPDLEDRCRQVLRQASRVVVLVGDAGVGKSTLAQYVAMSLAPPAKIVVLNIGSPERLRDDVVAVLGDEDATNVITAGDAVRQFARLLGRDGASNRPAVVILNDAQDNETIRNLLPATTLTLAIVTTNNPGVSADRWPTVAVGPIEPDEAVRMVRTRFSEFSDAEAPRLASALGGNPLAIEHVCGYLGRPGSVSLESFLEALERHAASALHLKGVERSLKVIYQLSLEQMDVPTRRLLDVILSAGATAIHLDYVADLWAGLADEPPGISASPGLAEITLDRALSELKDRSLVRTNYIEVGAPPPHMTTGGVTPGQARHGLLVIHSLTQRVLVSLRAEAVVAIRERVLARFDAAPELDGWLMGKTLPLDSLFRIRASVGLLLRVSEDVAAGHPGACALALRCAYQLGRRPSELADRAALAWHRQAETLKANRKNPAATPLSAELVHYMRWNPRATYAEQTWRAFDQIQHHSGGLWSGATLLMGNEWLPALANGIQPQSMLNLATAGTNDAHRRLATTKDPSHAQYNNVVLGQCYYIRGTVHYDLGDFGEAADNFGAAADAHKAAMRDGFYIREACECYRRWAETALKAGDYELASKRMRQYQGLLEEVGWPENPDYVSVVRFKLTLAQIAVNRELRQAQPGIAIEVPAWAAEGYEEALNLATTGPVEALYPAAKYGAICFQAFTDPRAALDALTELADWFGKGFGALRCELTALKLRAHLALEEHSQLSRSAAAEAQSLADRFQSDYLARYWSVDALATALALGKLTGQPPDWLDGVQAEATTELEAIKRLDKLEIAINAATENFSALQLLAE